MTPEQVHDDLLRTKELFEIALARLENRMVERLNAIEAKLNALDAKLNNQRTLLIVAILGVAAQIVNAWVLHR
jgi:hypothetical protein